MKSIQDPDTTSKKLLFYGLGVGAISAAATAQGAVVSTTSGLTANNIAFSLQNTIAPMSEGTSNAANAQTGAQFAITTQGSNKGAGADNSQGTSANYLIETVSKTKAGGTTNVNYAVNVSAGTTIGAGATFTQTSVLNASATGNGNFTTGTTGFLGFEILATAPDNTTGKNEFGYANITVNNFGNQSTGAFTLNYYAFDNSGASITAGATAVPEPATTMGGLLVVGAGGIVAFRRRRQLASAPFEA